MEVGAAPIFWEVGSWGLWQAAGGCADLRMGSTVRNPGCTIGGCGGEGPLSLVRCGQNTVAGHLPRCVGGLADAEGSVPYDSGAPRKEGRKTGPRGTTRNIHNTHLTEKNDRKSRVPAAAAAFFRAARRWRSAFVSFWWHGVQSVRKLSRLQQPPPSATGIIWSACQ